MAQSQGCLWGKDAEQSRWHSCCLGGLAGAPGTGSAPVDGEPGPEMLLEHHAKFSFLFLTQRLKGSCRLAAGLWDAAHCAARRPPLCGTPSSCPSDTGPVWHACPHAHRFTTMAAMKISCF